MPVTHVSNSTVATGTSTSPAITGFSVTAGNALILLVNVSSARTFSGCSDTGGGTWVEQVDGNDGVRTVGIYRCVNHPGGTVDVTATLNSSGAWTAMLIQVTGQDNTTPDADAATLATASETNTVVYAAASSGFDVPNNAFVAFATRSNAGDTATGLTGYTMITTTSLAYQFGYRAFSTGENSHRPGFTKSSTTRATFGGCYAMAEAAAAAGGMTFMRAPRLTTLSRM